MLRHPVSFYLFLFKEIGKGKRKDGGGGHVS